MLWFYKGRTPGVDVCDNATTILGEFSEPQPDASLVVLPESGGQSHINNAGYLEGAPELTAEVALSSESYDMHAKLRDYQSAGVKEYIVVLLKQQKIVWHVRESGQAFVESQPGPDGILRSRFFAGLWLDPVALLRGDVPTLLAVLERGLASPEHKKFVESLTRRK